MNQITAEQLHTWITEDKDFQLIDIRPEEDYDDYHISGAIHMPRTGLKNRQEEIARDKDVVIYCRYGMKAESLVRELRYSLGLRNVVMLQGGIFDWAKDYAPEVLERI